eukprot:6802674-Alexandrium_andersonii.AAC.1
MLHAPRTVVPKVERETRATVEANKANRADTAGTCVEAGGIAKPVHLSSMTAHGLHGRKDLTAS